MSREKLIEKILMMLAFSAIGSLVLITVFIFIEGLPIIIRTGVGNFIFGSHWAPTKNHFGILAMILVANAIVERHPIRSQRLPYILLCGSLVFVYLFPMQILLTLPFTLSCTLGVLILSVPLFFAAIVFANSFRRTEDVSQALGSNLLGAVLGGFAEYLSLILGLRALILIALLFYVISAVALRHRAPGVV